MLRMLETLRDQLVLLAAIGTALTALYRWTARPLRDAVKRLRSLEEDTADLLWDSLQTAHDAALSRGWCTAAEKQRLVQMHARYKAKGRNHLAATYENDILRLPEERGEAHA